MTTLTPFDSRDPVNETKGGTNQSSYTTGDLLYASGSNTLSKLTIGSADTVLTVQSGIPQWATSTGPSNATNYLNTLYLVDDYITGFNTWPLRRTFETFGAGTYATGLGTGTSTNPGIIRLSSAGATASIAATWAHGGDMSFGAGTVTLTFIAKLLALSNGTTRFAIRIGFGNQTVPFTDGAWFEYTDNVNSGNWQVKTMNNSSTSTGNSTTAADTNWHKFTIVANAAGTSVAFYIDDVEITGSPRTAQIPTGSRVFSPAQSIVNSLGTGTAEINTDLIILKVDLTSSR